MASRKKTPQSTSRRSVIHATDSTRSGCRAKRSAATAAAKRSAPRGSATRAAISQSIQRPKRVRSVAARRGMTATLETCTSPYAPGERRLFLFQDPHLALQSMTNAVLGHLDVVSRLKIQPESLRNAEISGQAYSRVRRDGALALNDLVDAASRNGDLLGELILRDVQRSKELLHEDLAWQSRGELLLRHSPPPSGSRRLQLRRHHHLST